MEDEAILDLYWGRSEAAIQETQQKYGRYCFSIAYGVLGSRSDSEECVNDAYLRAWEAIPPQRPAHLQAFLGTVTRNLALDRYRNLAAQKRKSSQMALGLEELQNCLPAADTERLADDLTIVQTLNEFLESLSPEARWIFLRRYWMFQSVREIAAAGGFGESRVKMSLLRSRKALKRLLEREGIKL